MNLRPYQQKACLDVRALWDSGTRSVCLVAPTGAGKTVMCEELIEGDCRALWLEHRRDLNNQVTGRLVQRFGRRSVGQIMPGRPASHHARIQVCTTQSLLAREEHPPADVIVIDECHHYVAEEWRRVAEAYPHARVVGATATPARADGAPLGDVFERMVVAALPSELVRDGYLAQVCMYRPERTLEGDLAEDVVSAWLRLSGGAQTFVFSPRIEIARETAREFRAAGISAECIDEETSSIDRENRLARFRSGSINVLTNVATLTEGIDVPEAACVVLARAMGHETPFLQTTGRALRPSAEKRAAIIIDLTGCSHAFGLPTDDREHSLDGRSLREPNGAEAREPNEATEFQQIVVGEPLAHVGVVVPVEPIEPIVRPPSARKRVAPSVLRTVALVESK